MHGLKGGGWKRKRPGHGHHRWDDLAGNRRNADPGTYHRLAPPRLPPTLLRHGASAKTFSYLAAFTWRRVWSWLRRKHRTTNWKQLRRRYQPEDRLTQDGVEMFNPAAVSIVRYRYRGTDIPSPWQIRQSQQSTA